MSGSTEHLELRGGKSHTVETAWETAEGTARRGKWKQTLMVLGSGFTFNTRQAYLNKPEDLSVHLRASSPRKSLRAVETLVLWVLSPFASSSRAGTLGSTLGFS